MSYQLGAGTNPTDTGDIPENVVQVENPTNENYSGYLPTLISPSGRSLKRSKIFDDGEAFSRIEFMEGEMKLPLTGGNPGDALIMSTNPTTPGEMEFAPMGGGGGGGISNPFTADVDGGGYDVKNVNEVEANITKSDVLESKTGGSAIALMSGVDGGGFDITNVGKVDTRYLRNVTGGPLDILTNGAGNGIRILAAPNAVLEIGEGPRTVYNAGTIEQRFFRQEFQPSGSFAGTRKTVHITNPLGFTESIVTYTGQPYEYYALYSDTTYVIHGAITVDKGFSFADNTVLKGASTSASITFDESSADIVGFKAENQNLIVQDLTIIGGGGHFSTTQIVGLFQATNFDTTAAAPFYGRNKRFLVSGCNIVAPYALGSVRGYGTLNILDNFINGGGGSASGVYTIHGLEVADGLSFEFRGNKCVLFAGAQISSSLSIITFKNSTISGPVTLGINACIISGNIFHPRDAENAIKFENGAITALGTISSNTFIRTGGTAPLIEYERSVVDDNYNKTAVVNYEVNANAGVLDVLPTCLCTVGISNANNSSTYNDITFPVTSFTKFNRSKRWGLQALVAGVLNGPYKEGNYIRDASDATKFAYIARVDPSNSNLLTLLDFNNTFTSTNNYQEVDKNFLLTGTTSSDFGYGRVGDGTCELQFLDKDPADCQLGISITHTNSSNDKEVQFRLSYDEGSGYVADTTTQIATTNPKASPRDNTSAIHTLKRFKKGDKFMIEMRYQDNTTSEIVNLSITAQ